MTRKSLHVLDLFCGAGGLSYGFERAGFKVLLGIDNDPVALRTFKENHVDSQTICGDISEISFNKDIKPILKGKSIDVIVGGPPCQGFSLSGPRNFNDPRNRLYMSFIRLVQEIKPRAFVIENVPGLVSLFKGEVTRNIVAKFEEIGYNVKYEILLASNFGVPQNRRRVIFVGTLNGENEYQYPEAENRIITSEMALSDLPPLEHELGLEKQDYFKPAQNSYQTLMRMRSPHVYNHIAAAHSERVRHIISLVPDGGNYKDLPEKYRNTRNFNVAWTRFASNKPAPTVDTGHRHHFHYKYDRVPTVRESARIQSFPDDFIFYGNKTQQFRQVGNAVPPLLAERIADRLMKTLEVENEQV